MSNGVPPPPTQSETGSYQWVDWYNKLTIYLNTGSSIPWAVIDKAGSKLSDIADRTHSQIQSLAGSAEGYHVSAAHYAALDGLVAGNVSSFNTRTGAVTLTSTDITDALSYTPAPTNSPAFTTSIGFNGTAAISKPTVSGSRGGNAALASLLTALANYGLITDSTTAS
jgi:hypothetical protein